MEQPTLNNANIARDSNSWLAYQKHKSTNAI